MFSKVFFILVASAISVVATPGLSLKVSSPSVVDGVQNLKVVATVTNTGTETLKLLNDPRGLLNQNPTRSFTITNVNGTSPVFKGTKVKYVPEIVMKNNQNSSFTTLEPGETVEIPHDLSSIYDFSSSGIGNYKFEPSNLFHYVSSGGELVEIFADHQPTNLKLGGLLSAAVESITGLNQKREEYKNCSSSRQTDIKNAVKQANKYAASTYSYTNNLTNGTERYGTWFGKFDNAHVTTVKSHFRKIKQEGLKNFSFDCSCTEEDVFAYVYPDEFGTIYLCGAFWKAPLTGTDSKAGTLIHESSHFTKNGGTQDVAYGQDGAKNLAQKDPAKAITNADSHEYFAENTPALA